MSTSQTLTQVEFEPADFIKAEAIAGALGYEQTAYTSTSALWGLYCLPENPDYAKKGQATKGGCIIKTLELGLLFVQGGEDVHLGYDWQNAFENRPRYTLDEIEDMPTIHQGQFDNLKYQDANTKIWLSRLTVEDGQPYNNQVTIERLQNGCWVEAESYEAR